MDKLERLPPIYRKKRLSEKEDLAKHVDWSQVTLCRSTICSRRDCCERAVQKGVGSYQAYDDFGLSSEYKCPFFWPTKAWYDELKKLYRTPRKRKEKT